MSQAEFSIDNRFITDMGPACVSDGCLSDVNGSGMYLYLVEGPQLIAQCALCHKIESFQIIGEAPETAPDVRQEHESYRRRR